MICNINKLKRMMKQEAKIGLIMAASEKEYYMRGRLWEIQIKKEYMPKQIKAEMIEICRM